MGSSGRLQFFRIFLITLLVILPLINSWVIPRRLFSSRRYPGWIRRPTQKTLPQCIHRKDNIDVSEPVNPGVFSDLTQTEFVSITQYLLNQSDLNIKPASTATTDSAYIQVIELLPPNKGEVLQYLDNNGDKPKRWAKVVLNRGDIATPEVQEYKVGPLPNPNSHTLINYSGRRKNPVPFAVRPPGTVDVRTLGTSLVPQLLFRLGGVLFESFGINLAQCEERCLTFSGVAVSTSNFGGFSRRLWIGFNYEVEFFTLFPVDLQVLLEVDGANIQNYRLSTVWYNQQRFDDLDEFLAKYVSGGVTKIQRTFPTESEREFARMDIRGDILTDEKLRAPRQIEPDGKRYSVQNQRVNYLGWSFYYRMSTTSGPMLFDVKYRGNRIAYEISVQEIAVFYSANNPARRFTDLADSFGFLGNSAKTLVPGGDCPEHATFLPSRHMTDSTDSSVLYRNSLCVFEQATGVPLRRHHSFDKRSGWFYNGLLDDVLTLRTIVTVGNYDYVLDFIFHQNGVLDVKALSTGYILTSLFSTAENNYGFKLEKDILGNIHHHMFNFKVDVDIQGTRNRFESLNIEVEEADNTQWSSHPGAATYPQIAVRKKLYETELEAAYQFNFNTPKYLIFHNENAKDKFGNNRAYRVSINGMSKQTLPVGKGHEPSISWSRYQMAVTKYHPDEMTSSSMYAQMDAFDPVVNFQSYLDNNERIVDEDLVAWVTIGIHHIPHTEDLPVTTTPGGHLSFSLMPYNYFPEDPSMASRSAIRIDKNPGNETQQVTIKRYGLSPELKCFPDTKLNYDETITKDDSIIFSD